MVFSKNKNEENLIMVELEKDWVEQAAGVLKKNGVAEEDVK